MMDVVRGARQAVSFWPNRHLTDANGLLFLANAPCCDPSTLSPEVYEKLRFPHLDEAPGGRAGRDLFRGEPGWAEIMASPGWSELGEVLLGEAFMKTVIGLFADDIRSGGALIDPRLVYLDPYIEPRQEVKKSVLHETHDPNALFLRFDFQAVTSTHWSFVHTDWSRRIVGGVFFMTSAADEGMEGGEFGLFLDLQFRNDRNCHAPKLEKAFPYEHNKGILVLNCNSGFHGPLPIRRLTGTRKWIYYAISSRRNVWPVAEQGPGFGGQAADLTGSSPAPLASSRGSPA